MRTHSRSVARVALLLLVIPPAIFGQSTVPLTPLQKPHQSEPEPSGTKAQSVSNKKPKMEVKVIETIPTATTYHWWTPGSSSSECSAEISVNGSVKSKCTGNYTLPEAGTQNLKGAKLHLLLPDGRIVIAECETKLNWSNWGNDPAYKYRSCRTPAVNETYKAEFRGNNVKITDRLYTKDGSGSPGSETYKITNILEPPI